MYEGAVFQEMLDSRIEEFCGYIKPPVEYTDNCTATSAELYDLLVDRSSYPITSYIIGGGLPVAKNTSTCLKADADVTIYVDWLKLNVTNAIAANIQLHKKWILDEWWRLLTDFTPPDSPGDVIKRTPNSLHFVYQVGIGTSLSSLTTSNHSLGSCHRYSSGLPLPPKHWRAQTASPQAPGSRSQTAEDLEETGGRVQSG